MIRKVAVKKTIAIFFLSLLTVETILPVRSWALTSGPVQPETQQFASAGTSEMVDLSTGDFKYNIPLIDVDGYPVNLSYNSGVGIDDEASWVGLGWNVNVGAVNRQLRGIADDALGDTVRVEDYVKPRITTGARISSKVEFAGFSSQMAGLGFGGTLAVSIFSDNYNGYGADIDVGTSASQSIGTGGSLTSGMSLGAGISMNSSTSDGVSVSPNLSLSVSKKAKDFTTMSAGLSGSLGYNTREGVKSTTLGASFNVAYNEGEKWDKKGKKFIETADFKGNIPYSYTSYNTPVYYPKTTLAFKSRSNSYSFNMGGAIWLAYLSGGFTGYKSVREIANPAIMNRAYGFMYAEKGKNDRNALMDFMREKDNPVVPNLPNLAIPIATPDLFTYSGQAGGGQFRLYRGTTGTFSDAYVEDVTENGAFSTEYGFGTYFHGGATYNKQTVTNKTGKWTRNNDFLPVGDFPILPDVEDEQAYFKMVGEKTVPDNNYYTFYDQEERFYDKVGEDKLVRVGLKNKRLSDKLMEGDDTGPSPDPALPYRKRGRQVRRSPVLALTAQEVARGAGLDTAIYSYPFIAPEDANQQICDVPAQQKPVMLPRVEGNKYRKKHHISELTVQGDNGARMVYGLPVYNIWQTEYTFAVNPDNASQSDKDKNLVPVTIAGGKPDYKVPKSDEYFHKETQPGYATSYLLTGVLSPDYVDLTKDGISDDDPGTAVKFNYSKVAGNYMWRTPVTGSPYSKAQHNKALNADKTDDKANIVLGEKELWYVHSIESKTKIAYFITEDRQDGLGVSDLAGTLNSGVKQKRLKEIRLYSKMDLNKPIKTVVFSYDYSLCPGTPNSQAEGGGKLTLKHVYFKYNNSERGQEHQYTFEYKNPSTPYGYLLTDRWGTYKSADRNSQNGFPALRNDEFPYTPETGADEDAANWSLNKISLPTGGEILVEYEADDYAYVQDRRAMKATKIAAMVKKAGGTHVTTDNLFDAEGFKVELPEGPVQTGMDDQARLDWFMHNYLNDQKYLYAKLFVNVSDLPNSTSDGHYDNVPCYAEVSSVEFDGDIAYVYFKHDRIGRVLANPFSFAAWQKMRLDYPVYSNPGYKNRIDDDRPVEAAVSALAQALANFSQLRENFNVRAKRKGYASKVNLEKSYTRLACYRSDKNGGGLRVKSIRMSDKWDLMAGGQESSYGQSYDYSIAEDGAVYSSGVASYEPAIGADENPMRLPVPYNEEFKWALSNLYYLEEPFGEALFPAPGVVYRKVTVQPLTADGNPSDKMGYTVSEFYTAKEFPVVTKHTMAEKVESEKRRWYAFFGGDYSHELYMSQGYVIYLNDMHGKPFKEVVYNRTKDVISSVEYIYNAKQEGSHMRLTGKLPALEFFERPHDNMGRQVEVFVDLREQETANFNKRYEAGLDVIPTFLAIATPIPHVPIATNKDYKLFRSASLLKTVEDYGSLVETIKTVNGSTTRTVNRAFNTVTGDVVITETQNEFEDPIYTVNIPAFLAHENMGSAYQTLGMYLPRLITNETTGEIAEPGRSLLHEGDELIDLDTGNRLWVIFSEAQPGHVKKLLIDEGGRLVMPFNGRVKVIRSGFRNMLGQQGASIVTTKYPQGSVTLYDLCNDYGIANYPIIDAKGVLYHEAWGKPADCSIKSCPVGYSADGDRCIRRVKETTNSLFELGYGSQIEDWQADGLSFQAFLNGDYQQYKTGYWASGEWARLKINGVWATNVPDGTWWGMEFCVDVPQVVLPKSYYIGVAADDRARWYMDGVLIHDFSTYETYNHFMYHVFPILMTAGKHTFRVEAANAAETAKAVAFDIYGSNSESITSGDGILIASHTLFTLRDLAVDPSRVNVYTLSGSTRTAQKFECVNGGSLDLCDGTPNCGIKMPGDCPDGYTKSPDGQVCTPVSVIDNSPGLTVVTAPDSPVYDELGAILYDDTSPSGQQLVEQFWGGDTTFNCNVAARMAEPLMPLKYCGRLNESGVRLTQDITGPPKWVGATDCFTTYATGDNYYIGFSAESAMKVYLDGVLWKTLTSPNKQRQWYVYEVDLAPGQHTVRMEAMAASGVQPVFGLQVYKGLRSELVNASNLEVVYSSSFLTSISQNYNSFVLSDAGQLIQARETCGGKLREGCMPCQSIPNVPALNPYITGYLGNWAVWKEYVYMDKRNDDNVFEPGRKDLNIRQAGTYVMKKSFYGFSYYDWGVTKKSTPHDNSIPGWVVAREATLQDRNSQELESKDALGRFSSARFGFRNTLPVAVASNARHREIYYDGFEDYQYDHHCLARPQCDVSQFDIRKAWSTYVLDETVAHSGNYSLRLSQSVELKTWQFNDSHQAGLYLSINPNGEYFRALLPWLGLWGYAPMHGKQYIFSAWVKDEGDVSLPPAFTLKLNNQPVTLTHKATVEKWKLVEGIFTTPEQASGMREMSLRLTGGANVWIDDIRIFPNDGQIKTFSYDDRTLRLMGELDENNYATFYEYDDEGSLARVKKETEKGILTIKESRTAYKKKPE